MFEWRAHNPARVNSMGSYADEGVEWLDLGFLFLTGSVMPCSLDSKASTVKAMSAAYARQKRSTLLGRQLPLRAVANMGGQGEDIAFKPHHISQTQSQTSTRRENLPQARCSKHEA